MRNPFSSIPALPSFDELVEISFNRAFSKQKSVRKRNFLNEIKDREISRMQSVSDTITSKLDSFVKNFPNIDELNPLYRELLEIIAGRDMVKHSLGAIFWASKMIRGLLRSYSHSIRKSNDPDEIAKLRREFLGRSVSVLRRVKNEIEFLRDSIKKLRELPDFDIESPTVIIAGMPNTGKSTLLSRITRKKPEVAPYPFTTKGLIIGHLILPSIGTIQIVDTPGLLDRPLSVRNKMELQAVAALRHFRGSVLFIFDPTETCGYSLDQQISLLKELMNWLSKPFLAALNKCDLLDDFRENFSRAERELEKMGVRYLSISAEKGDKLNDLLIELENSLKVA